MENRNSSDNRIDNTPDRSFSYRYSAKEQEEIRKMEEKYKEKSEVENKMDLLRKLDAGVTAKATMQSMIVGIIGTLLLGVGMCCCMVWTQFFILGVVVGIIGIVILALAYPVYQSVMKKEKEKVRPRIMALTAELKR